MPVEGPASGSWFDELLHKSGNEPAAQMRKQVGEENFRIYTEMLRIKEMTNSVQARLPFEFFIH